MPATRRRSVPRNGGTRRTRHAENESPAPCLLSVHPRCRSDEWPADKVRNLYIHCRSGARAVSMTGRIVDMSSPSTPEASFTRFAASFASARPTSQFQKGGYDGPLQRSAPFAPTGNEFIEARRPMIAPARINNAPINRLAIQIRLFRQVALSRTAHPHRAPALYTLIFTSLTVWAVFV